MAQSLELPDHMRLAALEEYLLLTAFYTLAPRAVTEAEGKALSLAGRNDIIKFALDALPSGARASYLDYADALSESIVGCTRISYPLPPRAPGDNRWEAEQCAENHLREGTGALWVAVRQVITMLPLCPHNRDFADGYSITLGAYRKGGILGLSRHTQHLQAACVLLNAAVISVCGRRRWTSLMVSVDNNAHPHVDRHNAGTPSLLIGFGHYSEGHHLWVVQEGGRHYCEIEGRMYAGCLYQTSASGVLFSGQDHFHATCDWQGGCRAILVAYSIQNSHRLLSGTAEFLHELGFVLPEHA
ncbi:unnamed protein product [Symbiodinium sp. CCMP2592]|nr:unnamed protein product [Symbiodinium sp. CCMP2592]